MQRFQCAAVWMMVIDTGRNVGIDLVQDDDRQGKEREREGGWEGEHGK